MTRKTYTYWEKFWLTDCSYDPTHKGSWHHEARTRMRRLAKELGLERGTYDIRSNMAGPAVSGEVTLHGEDIYVQVSQGCGGPSMGILIRTCEGRKDYTGGRNNFANIRDLEDIPLLAERCRFIMGRAEVYA